MTTRAVNFTRRDASLQSIALPLEDHGVGPLEEPIDGGIGQHTVREHLAPFGYLTVGGEHEAGAVLASINEVEHLFGDLAVHGDGGPVVNDPEWAGEHALEELIERAVGL